MKRILRYLLAIIGGWFVGSIVNMGLIKLGHYVFPIADVDFNDLDQFAQIIPTLKPQYFLFPFLAHALGTLVGAIIAGILAAENKLKISLIIGILFLIGGIAVHVMLPGPIWFAITDILFAYIPMAYLGGRIAVRISK